MTPDAPDELRLEVAILANRLSEVFWTRDATTLATVQDALLRFAKQQQAKVWRELSLEVLKSKYYQAHNGVEAIHDLCDATARELEKL